MDLPRARAGSATIARGLVALGVSPGERVVVWATNVPEWIVLQFALAKIGAILVTANTSLRARDIDYLLRQSEAATLATIGGFRDVDYIAELGKIGATAGSIATLQRIIAVGERRRRAGRRRRAVRSGRRCPLRGHRQSRRADRRDHLDTLGQAVVPDAVINMQYTSGTTGFPKGVMLSSRNILNNGFALRRGARLHAGRPAVSVCAAVSLFWLCHRGDGRFHARRLSVRRGSVRSEACSRNVDRERCTALYGVPTMFIAELEHPEFSSYDLTSLRTGVMAGSLCPEPLMRRVMRDMNLSEITIVYGLTEASPVITMTPRASSVEQRSQTVGVLPGSRGRIVDPETGRASRPASAASCVRADIT